MKNRKKKSGVFWRAYTILCIVLVLIIVSVTFLLYDFVKAFELFRPESAVDDYVSSLTAGDISDLFAPRVGELASGCESGTAVIDAVTEMLGEKDITYVEAVIDEGDAIVYDIYCGEKVLSVSLSETSGGKYGFKNYTVTSAVVFDEWITSRLMTVTAIVPEGAKLIINGHDINDDYIVGTTEAGSTISEFERDESFGFTLEIYEIPNVFGKVDIAARDDEGEVLLSNPSEGVYTSDYEAVDSVYTVIAPVDAVVTVNGIKVGDEYVTGETVALDAKEYESDSAPKCCEYSIKGLRHEPTVTAALGGESLASLTHDGCDIAFAYPDSYKKSYTVHLPDGLTLYCNGVPVSEENIVSRDGEYSVPESVAKFVKSEKTCVEYIVDGLYASPTFTSSDNNCVVESENDIYTFYPAPSESEIEKLSDEAQNFTELYIKYSYEGTDYTKDNYNAVIAHVMAGTDAFDIIEVSYNSMIFNSNFKVDKLETEIYDMVKYADNCYGVKVDFDSHGNYYKYEKVSVGTYTMIWIVSDGVWELAYFKFV